MTWSLEDVDVDVGIKASLAQSYPILLSTLLSIGRGQMTASDTECALTLTSPPLMVYLTISSICNFFGVQTGLYKRVRSHPHIIRFLGALVLPVWIALDLTNWFSSRAFCDDYDYGDGTLAGWLYFLLWKSISPVVSVSGGWIYALIMSLFFFLFLFRRWSQVMAGFRVHQKGTSKSRRWWRVPGAFAKCAWCVPVIMDTRSTKSNTI